MGAYRAHNARSDYKRINMEDLFSQFERLGFADKEAKIYLALLQHGSATAQEVAHMVGLPRPTVHRKLLLLCKRGIIQTHGEDDEGMLFLCEAPERLQTLVHQEMQSLEERRRMIDGMMDRLRAMHRSQAKRPHVRYIDTLQGLRTVQREFELMGEDILQMVGLETLKVIHGEPHAPEHRDILAGQGRLIRAILITHEPPHFPKDFNIEYVIVPPEAMPVTGEMSVCGNRVLLFSYIGGLTAVEITSQPIAQTVRASLELAWQRAREIGTYHKHSA